ncbi:hypothetical protein J2X46_000883 [Nocardioides sp. BE266]|uniref:hypothetical protein n=1 Tax=Nocardioides sp. BE266 TaxID=2817725 RepID=UPI00285FBA0A|nr:hypothetical protein [Nocardioides sp. BE266]MDR7251907.1 hypothetical protein [Nocardioides sp. BE266]
MTGSNEIEVASTKFTQILDASARLPGVRIDRSAYLRTALKRHCSEEQIAQAIAQTPAAAGIPRSVIEKVARTSIRFETAKVTGISAAAGIPGGMAMAGTVPADVAQYFGHVIRITQKLAYIHSWPDLFADDEELDEATAGLLTLFIGVMFGVQTAQTGITKVSAMMAGQVVKKLPQKALTQGTVYPIVKKVAGLLGARMTKQIFANGVAKFVPVIGGIASGGLTFATFRPMAKRLDKHLSGLDLVKPEPLPAGAS